jgi:hypothetical protein
MSGFPTSKVPQLTRPRNGVVQPVLDQRRANSRSTRSNADNRDASRDVDFAPIVGDRRLSRVDNRAGVSSTPRLRGPLLLVIRDASEPLDRPPFGIALLAQDSLQCVQGRPYRSERSR